MGPELELDDEPGLDVELELDAVGNVGGVGGVGGLLAQPAPSKASSAPARARCHDALTTNRLEPACIVSSLIKAVTSGSLATDIGAGQELVELPRQPWFLTERPESG